MERLWKGSPSTVWLLIVLVAGQAMLASSLADGDMRLAGFESSRLAGRVDIHFSGTWFTICNDQFTLREAAVVCRQLGLGYPVRLFNEDTDGPDKVSGSTSDSAVSRFGSGSGFITLDDVVCNGDEPNIFSCQRYITQTHNCFPQEAVGVQCSDLYPQPYNGQVRLVGGEFPSQGRLEVYFTGQWGAVCGEGTLDANVATTVCTQLGYSKGSVQAVSAAEAVPVWLTSLSCSSPMSCLSSCLGSAPTTTQTCSSNTYINIACAFSAVVTNYGTRARCELTSASPGEGTLRLTGGATANSGVVQVYLGGKWGGICGAGTQLQYNTQSLDVACHQLGYRTWVTAGSAMVTFPVNIASLGVNCSGGEERITDCSIVQSLGSSCPQNNQFHLNCSTSLSAALYGAVTLTGGGGASGTLAVERIGSLCDTPLSRATGDVVCRQMGYQGARAVKKGSFYGTPALRVTTSAVCNGSEQLLTSCQLSTCSSTAAAGVQCNVNISDADRGDLRLVGGNSRAGRLEMQLDGMWTGVCSFSFSATAASVACSQMGLGSTGTVLTDGRFGTANDGTLVVQRCSGTEAKLYDCWYYAVGACPVVTVECKETCPLLCQNGGTLNASSCTCNCTLGYTGRNCSLQVSCGNLTVPSNGRVDTSAGTSFGDTAMYSCDTGYMLSGPAERTCQADGQWNGSEPTCEKVSCGQLTNLSNGRVNTSAGTSFGDTAMYSCDTGYMLSGPAERTCQADGQWNGSEPVCERVFCSSLSTPSNGQVSTSAGTSFGDTAMYSCNTGYMLNGPAERTCQADGQWNGSEPTCERVNCSQLVAPSNGRVNTSLGTSFGGVAIYMCNEGYTLNGLDLRLCQANGQWTGSEPTCERVSCSSLAAPSNGYVDTSAGISFGDTATYSCDTGYTLHGSTDRTCQANGQWNGSVPTCEICTYMQGGEVKSAEVGQPVILDNPCLECICAADGTINCTDISPTCPPPPICPRGTTTDRVNVTGQCCPMYSCAGFCTPTSPCQNGGTCDEVTDTCMCPTGYSGDLCDEFCIVSGTPYAVGDTIPSADPCLLCLCAAHADIQCIDNSSSCPPPPSCPSGTTANRVNVTGQCCLMYNCTAAEFCTPTSPCQNGGTCDEVTDTCMCPTGYSGVLCDEFCLDNGTPYAVGDTIPSADPCMICTCASHQDIQCTDISGTCPPSPSCPPGTNTEAVNVTGQCCPNYTACTGFCTPTSPCQNGGTCDEVTDTCMCPTGYSGDLCDEFCMDSGTPYAVGDTVPSADPCMMCLCAAHDDIQCTDNSSSCPAPPSCPSGTTANRVNVTGQCCPMYNCTAAGFCTPTSPCQNGGTCDEVTDTCMCPTGYSGVLCDEFCLDNGTPYAVGGTIPSADPCMICTCASHQDIQCTDISGTCPSPPSCPPGTNYEAVNVTGQCCPNYTACTGFCTPTSPCQNGGTCNEVTDTCMCPTDYSGDLCDEFCIDSGTSYAVGDTVPSADPCMMCLCAAHDDIQCTDNSSSCPAPPSCPSGTTANRVNVTGQCCPMYNCTAAGFCTPTSPCQNGGTCDEVTDTCMCPTGYSGVLCDEFCLDNGTPYAVGDTIPSADPCMICTCAAHQNIQCTDISGTCPPSPSCPPGTNTEAVNVTGQCCPMYTACTGFCTSTSPCQNGGTCDEVADTCMCPTGYSGDLCDEFCTDNGTPFAVGDTIPSTDPCMMCTCAAHQDIQCTDISGTCPPPPSCPTGTNYKAINVTGQCCPMYTNCTGFCTPTSPCQNGGTCDEVTDTCMCPTGYSGDLCACSRSCQNGGTVNSASCTCDCADGYNGSNCENCAVMCQNSGTLDTTSCNCNCANGFFGRTCNTTCPCQNGGTCTTPDLDTCACVAGWTGQLCETAVTCSSDPGTPTNGQPNFSSTTYNSVVTYTCDDGYALMGSNSRTCLDSGQWNGSVPQCTSISISFSTKSYSVNEDGGSVTVAITASNAPQSTASFEVILQDGTAQVSSDVEGPDKLQVQIPSGSTSVSVTIRIVNDMIYEGNENFKLTLSSKGGAQLGSPNEALINIVDDDFCTQEFFFPQTSRTPVNTVASMPCSELDSSFLSGGMMTAKCSANRTWGPLDMSQCTFQSDASVTAVAVVEVVTDSPMDVKDIVQNALLKANKLRSLSMLQVPSSSVVLSIRLSSRLEGNEISIILSNNSAKVSKEIVIQKADYCDCCEFSAIEALQNNSISASFNLCTGLREAPQACTCSQNGLECLRRFDFTAQPPRQCSLDVDEDGVVDFEDPCVGCCLPSFDLAFQWPRTLHSTSAEAPCSEIHPSFSDTKVRRRCRSDDSWEPADISSCTFKNATTNPILLLTTNLTVSTLQNRDDAIKGIQEIFENQLPNLTEVAMLSNSSYNITALTVASTVINGTNVTTVVFIVDFAQNVSLTENATAVPEKLPSGVPYTFGDLRGVTPSRTCPCTAGGGQIAHLCIGTSISPCDCSDLGTCQCIDPYINDTQSNQCTLDTDGDMFPDYRDSCPTQFGIDRDLRGCPMPIIDEPQACDAEIDTEWKIQWPEAAPESTQFVRCPGEGDTTGLGLAQRSCQAGGMWGPVDASDCGSVAVREVSKQTENFLNSLNTTNSSNLNLTESQIMVIQNISESLNAALMPSDDEDRSIPPKDLETTAEFVDTLAGLGENNDLFNEENNETQEVVADILSNVLDESNAPAYEATAQKSAAPGPQDDGATSPATSILQSTERVANVIGSTLSVNRNSFTISRPNLALHGQRLSFGAIRRGFQFPGPGVTLPNFRGPASIPQIRFPPAFLFAARGIPMPTEMPTETPTVITDQTPTVTTDQPTAVTTDQPTAVTTDQPTAVTTDQPTATTSDQSPAATTVQPPTQPAPPTTAPTMAIEVVNVVMNNMENYLPTDVVEQDDDASDAEEVSPASRVFSSQIPGYDGGEVDTNETVEIIFPLIERVNNLTVPIGRRKLFRCAFFNFKGGANATGAWSYSGVKTSVINDTHVRCNSSHLTSFVVLVSVVDDPGSTTPLDYITYIGCSISFICLLASIAFFLSLRKELIQKVHNFVHLNLCIALSLGLLLFLTGIQTATANVFACKVMTALLHYFFLATFTWTLCEAVLIYVLLVKVFGANDKKWIYLYLALGWIPPIPVVVITGGMKHEEYLIRSTYDHSSPNYNMYKACWLPTHEGVIYAFVGPMVAIILINAVLLTISLGSLAKSQWSKKSVLKSETDEKRQQLMEVGKRLFKATLILVPLLGFTWIIGLFAVGEEGRVFAYLFVIANVFQGVLIFLLHVVRHEKVYGKIKNRLPKCRKRVSITTGTASATKTTPTHSAKSDWADSKKSSSFAAESEALIEFGQKKDEDAESIKEGDLEMKLTTIDEKAEDTKDDIDKPTAVTNTSFGLDDVIVGTVTEDEKSKVEDTEPKDKDKDEFGLTTTATTFGVQNDSDAANGKDSSEGN